MSTLLLVPSLVWQAVTELCDVEPCILSWAKCAVQCSSMPMHCSSPAKAQDLAAVPGMAAPHKSAAPPPVRLRACLLPALLSAAAATLQQQLCTSPCRHNDTRAVISGHAHGSGRRVNTAYCHVLLLALVCGSAQACLPSLPVFVPPRASKQLSQSRQSFYDDSSTSRGSTGDSAVDTYQRTPYMMWYCCCCCCCCCCRPMPVIAAAG
jgi:hypothetical protein